MFSTHQVPSGRRIQLGSTAIAAFVLAVVAAQPAFAAASWAGESKLSSDDVSVPEVVRTGSSSAMTVWQVGPYVYARRTADGGATWAGRQTLASGVGASFAVAAANSTVHLTYIRRQVLSDGGWAFRLYYRRSLNGGATWQTAKALTSATSRISDVDVAAGASGRVTVAWTGLTSGNIHVRNSGDSGTTFGAAKYVGHTSNSEPGRVVTYRGDVAVALGDAVTYVAYTSARDTLSIRRSTTSGSSWSAPVKLSSTANIPYSLVAAGSRAVIGYTSYSTGNMGANYRRTTDKGAIWSAQHAFVTHATGQFSARPTFAYRAGTLAVVFKYGGVGTSPVWHRESTDFGATFGARTRVSVDKFDISDPEPGGVAILDGRRLAGYAEHRGTGENGLWVRRG